MNKPNEVLSIFEKYTAMVDEDMATFLSKHDSYEMYRMMEYFLGFRDEKLAPRKRYSGKRFRPGLTLIIADFFGVAQSALPVASSVELFHNFSLIHDDIEDDDSLRRGVPTVWKLWGVNQALNTGDAQLILSLKRLNDLEDQTPGSASSARELLFNTYLGITEGQYLDIKLSECKIGDPFVTVENYNEMIRAKTSILVGAAAKAAGIMADKSKEACEALWDYGLNLGMAFQYADDLASIWGSTETTGKVEAQDLKERKKTLPIIYLFQRLDDEKRAAFADIYDKTAELTHSEISEIKTLLSEKEAHDYVWGEMHKMITASSQAVKRIGLNPDQEQLLLNINKALIPNMKWWDA